MTKLELLEDELHAKYGLTIDNISVAGRSGVILLEEGKPPYIAVDKRLGHRKQTAIAYHEAGHLHCGITKRPRRDELRADKWAFRQLIKVEDIIEAIIKGVTSVYELADELDLDERFLQRYLKHMSERHIFQEYGNYVISYSPIIVYNWKTGQMWPGG